MLRAPAPPITCSGCAARSKQKFGHQVESIMGEKWYYNRGGTTGGPVSALDLKHLASSGQLLPADLVWKEGMREWLPAEQLKGLFVVAASATLPQPSEQVQELITCQICPRCEAEHRQLPIKRLSKPTYDGFTHWGVCPATGDPVLFTFKHGSKNQQ